MSTPQKQITIPLKQFIEYALSGRDKIPIDETLATIISSIDKEESLCHIEFPADATNYLPILWSIQEWRTDYGRIQKEKDRAERDRQERILLEENVKLVGAKLATLTGLSSEQVNHFAKRMIINKKQKEISALGVTLRDRLEVHPSRVIEGLSYASSSK